MIWSSYLVPTIGPGLVQIPVKVAGEHLGLPHGNPHVGSPRQETLLPPGCGGCWVVEIHQTPRRKGPQPPSPQAARGPVPRGRRQCPAEESCAMKRKPSRSASNAPPTKKKEERKSEPDTEDSPKFNFTGRKTNDKRK